VFFTGVCVVTEEIHQDITKKGLYGDPVGIGNPGVQFKLDANTTIGFDLHLIKDVLDSNVAVDNHQFTPEFHFDNARLVDGSTRLRDGKNLVLDALKNPLTDARGLRKALGGYLHTLQDFYSHTDWVEISGGSPNSKLGNEIVPAQLFGTHPCSPADTPFSLVTVLLQPATTLTSGYFVVNAPLGQCYHGSPNVYGINKDDAPNAHSSYSPQDQKTYFDMAFKAAVLATQQFVSDIVNNQANNADSVCMLMTDKKCPSTTPPPGGCSPPTDVSITVSGTSLFNGSNLVTLSGGDFGTGPSSLAAWVTWNGVGSNVQNIFRDSNYPPGGFGAGYWIRISNYSQLEFFVGETVGFPPSAPRTLLSTSFSAGTEKFVVGTKDANGAMTLYIDGAPVASGLIDPKFNVNSGVPFTVGAWAIGPSEFFIGSIRDIAVFNRALTNSEVLSLYNVGSGQCP